MSTFLATCFGFKDSSILQGVCHVVIVDPVASRATYDTLFLWIAAWLYGTIVSPLAYPDRHKGYQEKYKHNTECCRHWVQNPEWDEDIQDDLLSLGEYLKILKLNIILVQPDVKIHRLLRGNIEVQGVGNIPADSYPFFGVVIINFF